jgi:hypothetical protein
MALWMTHGEQPPGGLFDFISHCNGAADAGQLPRVSRAIMRRE